MASSRPGASDHGIYLHGRLDAAPAVRTIALLLLPILLVVLVMVARANLVGARPTLLGLTAGAEDATPEQLRPDGVVRFLLRAMALGFLAGAGGYAAGRGASGLASGPRRALQ